MYMYVQLVQDFRQTKASLISQMEGEPLLVESNYNLRIFK